MTRCTSSWPGPCREDPQGGKHRCKRDPTRHPVTRMPTYENVEHLCRCDSVHFTSRALSKQRTLEP